MTNSIQRNRHTDRLKGYDYALAGAYFITILTYQHRCLFGEVINGEVSLNPYGKIALGQWKRLAKRFPLSDFSTFVIMPNHIHGIINLVGGAGDDINKIYYQIYPLRPYSRAHVIPGSLGAIVRAYKASVSIRINNIRGLINPPIWQRNYYDHIIRNEQEFEKIWKYIEANPEKWEEDRFHTSTSIKS